RKHAQGLYSDWYECSFELRALVASLLADGLAASHNSTLPAVVSSLLIRVAPVSCRHDRNVSAADHGARGAPIRTARNDGRVFRCMLRRSETAYDGMLCRRGDVCNAAW